MPTIQKELDSVLQKWTKNPLEQIPGIIAGVCDKDKVLYVGAAGVKSTDDLSDPMTVDTTVAFYSTTKSLTCTALLQLLERGLVVLDDPVELYLPEFESIKILTGFDKDDKPILVWPKHKATLRHLVTHTAGFAYTFLNEKYKKLQEQTGGLHIFKAKWEEFQSPLVFEPGTQWEYSSSIDWVGKVVESVTDLTLEEYFQQNILGPLDMKSCTFIRKEANFANHAVVHHRNLVTGELKAQPEMHPKVPQDYCGGQGLYGKVGDYLKYMQIFLNEGVSPITGAQILRKETLKNFCFRDLLTEDGLKIVELPGVQPQLSNNFEFYPGKPKGWSTNFLINKSELETGRSADSFSWSGLLNLYFWIDVKKGVAGYWASQLFPFFDKTCLDAFEEFESTCYEVLGKK